MTSDLNLLKLFFETFSLKIDFQRVEISRYKILFKSIPMIKYQRNINIKIRTDILVIKLN